MTISYGIAKASTMGHHQFAWKSHWLWGCITSLHGSLEDAFSIFYVMLSVLYLDQSLCHLIVVVL
jgi:hypothetical protein